MKHDPVVRKAFTSHRWNAKSRGIPFLLTYEEWLKIWEDSGHMHERGRKRGAYCMARHGDAGPYAVGNVSIVTVTDNVRESRAREAGTGGLVLPVGISRTTKRGAPYIACIGGKYVGAFHSVDAAVLARDLVLRGHMLEKKRAGAALGGGKGWYLAKDAKRSKPYRVCIGGKAKAYAATQQEAEAMYARLVAERKEAKHVG